MRGRKHGGIFGGTSPSPGGYRLKAPSRRADRDGVSRKNFHGDPVLLDLEEARELVAPADLEDVLQELHRAGVIARYLLGDTYVAIHPVAGRRFELSTYIAEATSPRPSDGRRAPAAGEPRRR